MNYQRPAALLALLVLATWSRAEIKTFCNPLDLDYGVNHTKAGVGYRHGADPVVVLFNNRYYLFSTWDKPGYRVSDDLAHWTYIPFKGVEFERKVYYTAAAVAQVEEWLYFIELSREPVYFYRTKDPASGKWEKVVEGGPYADPCLFVDPPSGRVFVTYGLEKPVHMVELDRETLKVIEGSDRELMPPYVPGTPVVNGWEVCTWDNDENSKGMRGNKTFNPCREGSWLTYFGGTYYLQYASPGTTVPGYADGVLTSKSVTGPYVYSNYSPISHKDSGFVTSAGHSCLFQDRYGNWWRAVTQLIGVHDRFERRIGLFPAGFDAEGVPYTRTEMGDLPITLAVGKRDHLGEVHPERWQVLSLRKTITASSELEGHEGKMAADEDIRTWWAAKSGEAGEWVQVDLGKEYDVRGVQVNLYEQDCGEVMEDVHRYAVEMSSDGKGWERVVDLSKNGTATPHHYEEVARRARYVRVTNVAMPGGGKFAVSELRVFGVGEGVKPGEVKGVKAVRDGKDRRAVRVSWEPVEGTTQYLVRYGISKGKWYQHHLVNEAGAKELTLHSLNAEPPYYFRVDAVNETGVTEGKDVVEAP